MAATAIRFLNLQTLIFPALLLIPRASATGTSSDTLYSGGNITDGNTLVSTGGSFTLGFFSPAGVLTNKRYLGIWFTEDADVVCWVANRDNPLNTTTGVLVMSSSGNLLLLDGSSHTAWSSNTTGGASVSAVAQLYESGNLVVREQGSGGTLWQSFDHASNTLLAGMRIGKNPQTGEEWSLTSWRPPNDPSTGEYRRVLDAEHGLPDGVSWRGGAKKYRTGPWNGLRFSGVPETASYSALISIQVVVRPDEVAFTYASRPGAPFSRLVLSEAGVLERLAWDRARRLWTVFSQAPRDLCDNYAMCGAFGLCTIGTATTQYCSCVDGFSPVSPSQWEMREASGGCRRNVALECGGNGTTTTDGFVLVGGIKLPDTDNATVDTSATLEQCRARCLVNCSCVAYAAADIRGGGGGTGCVMWTGDIVDVSY